VNCGDCGKKLITLSSNHGIVAFCPVCTPDVGEVFMSKGERKPMSKFEKVVKKYFPVWHSNIHKHHKEEL